ncbi:hypothetical protein AX17_004734 [Amanita inopinata Kibby_2008]|nr:hypothetical protein AX17_004734 [Amanita inopinata Kibby_2008]
MSNEPSTASLDIPPGLRPGLICYTSGGNEKQWLDYEKKKNYTNAFIIHNGKILLGYKKRGFGKEKYNGFGGKVEPGETAIQAAKRELQEEAGIEAPLEHAGELLFIIEGDPIAFYIDVFRATEYSGIVTETDEMRPQWFCIDNAVAPDVSEYPPIPFEKMWDDDEYWFPLLLQDRFFVGRADFKRNGDVFIPHRWWIGID